MIEKHENSRLLAFKTGYNHFPICNYLTNGKNVMPYQIIYPKLYITNNNDTLHSISYYYIYFDKPYIPMQDLVANENSILSIFTLKKEQNCKLYHIKSLYKPTQIKE